MTFHASTTDLINIVILAAGVGVCGMIFLLISKSLYLSNALKRSLQTFFAVLSVNLIAQIIVQAVLEHPGDGIHTLLIVVLFIDFAVGGIGSFIISFIVQVAAQPIDRSKLHQAVLAAMIVLHILLLVSNLFSNSMYYFDADNQYHRTSLYLLTNLGIILMLVFDAYILLRYGKNIDRRVRTAFWVYICAPIAGILLQTLFYGIQYILIASIISAVYVCLTVLKDQNEKYEAQKEESSRIETELNMAAQIQTHMLPSTFPAFPGRPEFDIYATMDPAKEVGGDFYDFFMVDDHLAMVMADVSGKGVPAALFMMTARTMIKDAAQSGKSPAEVLRYVNAQICENNPEDMFVTVWLGLLELSSGKLVWSDAGHEPLLLDRDGSWELMSGSGGIALGVLEPELLADDDPFSDCALYLKPGDALLQYTDGVTESMTAGREQFGLERLTEAVRNAPSSVPKELLVHIREQIDQFVKGSDQFDDITMLAMRYHGDRRTV